MIRFATLAAAAALAFAGPTAAAPSVPVAQTATDPGVPVEAVRAWLTEKGGVVGPINRDNGTIWISVSDGPLNWAIVFYSCNAADVCGDIQYAASFSNDLVTQAMVNDWNRDQRFLKAFFVPGEAGGNHTAVVQYDVLMQSRGVEQLTDPTALWLELIGAFGTKVGFFAAEPAA